MKKHIRDAIVRLTGASGFNVQSIIQTLWSGYGEVLRLRLQGLKGNHNNQTVVLKYVSIPENIDHPRGWNTVLSHQRKIRSYAVELLWYQYFAADCDDYCRVPGCLGVIDCNGEYAMLLEDLDASGFSKRLEYDGSVSLEISSVLLSVEWLAHFHARFLGESIIKAEKSLWTSGGYWHLATRPDEWSALVAGDLKDYAHTIDKKLSECRFQTIVHGDAKLANFCFADDLKAVAAVDFQYAGTGCGMKDLAYFMGSCLTEQDCERYEAQILKHYFQALRLATVRYGKQYTEHNLNDLEAEWRAMYPLAWSDFYRFLKGWSPDHWKINAYSERLCDQTIQLLKQEPPQPHHQEFRLILDLDRLLEAAVTAAMAAGDLIERYRHETFTINYKGFSRSLAGDVVTEVDVKSQALIAQYLVPISKQYDIAFIGEETSIDGCVNPSHQTRFESDYSWLVDPIDGTLPFIDNEEGYSVSIGLIDKKGRPLLGVVFDPYRHKLYSAIVPVTVNMSRALDLLDASSSLLPVSPQLVCFLDRSYVNDVRYEAVLAILEAAALAQGLEGVKVVAGYGAAVNACRVLDAKASGIPAVYIKLPKEQGGSIWDYAATTAIFEGLNQRLSKEDSVWVSDLSGQPLDLNRADSTYLNHKGVIYASSRDMAQLLMTA